MFDKSTKDTEVDARFSEDIEIPSQKNGVCIADNGYSQCYCGNR